MIELKPCPLCGTELFTKAGKDGYEVRFRTLDYKKFRIAEEACRQILDQKGEQKICVIIKNI